MLLSLATVTVGNVIIELLKADWWTWLNLFAVCEITGSRYLLLENHSAHDRPEYKARAVGRRYRTRERGRGKKGVLDPDGRVPAMHAHVQSSLGLPGTRIKGITLHLASSKYEAYCLQMSDQGNQRVRQPHIRLCLSIYLPITHGLEKHDS